MKPYKKWILYDPKEKEIIDFFLNYNTARNLKKHHEYVRMVNLEIRVRRFTK